MWLNISNQECLRLMDNIAIQQPLFHENILNISATGDILQCDNVSIFWGKRYDGFT